MITLTTGPVAAFDGTMSAPVVRDVTALVIVEETVFTSLVPMFPATETGAVALTEPTYPPLMEIQNIKSFQVATGAVLAYFRA